MEYNIAMKSAEYRRTDARQPEKAPHQRALPDIMKDRFSRTRGGNSELLLLSCTSCHSEVMMYQKDGKGGLVRCYFDRIYLPNDPTHPMKSTISKPLSSIPNLHCPSCDAVIGTPMIFKSERRFAYRIKRGSLAKKRLK